MRLMRLLSPHLIQTYLHLIWLKSTPNYDVSDGNSYNGGITSGLANRLIVELLAGLSLTKKGLTEGDPVRPNFYRGLGNTYDFGNGPKD